MLLLINSEYKLKENQVVVKVDKKYFRPTEVELLIGDPSKVKNKSNWQPKYSLDELVNEMLLSDIQYFNKELILNANGYTVKYSKE